MNRRAFFGRFGVGAVAAAAAGAVAAAPAPELPSALQFGTPQCPTCLRVLWPAEAATRDLVGHCDNCDKDWAVKPWRG